MGKGKLLKFKEVESFRNVVQAPYGLVKGSDFFLKGNWVSDFFSNNNPLVLELGCGKGEYTVELAERFPDKNFLGVDIKGARIWKGAKHSLGEKLKNAGFLRTNIEIIGQFFAPGEVEEIWLTFPDPQMKKTNKRLTSVNFLLKYKGFISKGGVIHLKTDSNFLYQYTLALIGENKFELLAHTADLYNSDYLDDILNIKTYYEKQWLGRGIAIKYLSFRLHENGLYREPDIKVEKDSYRSYGRNALKKPKDG